MRRFGRPLLAALTVASTIALGAGTSTVASGAPAATVPHYDHIFVVIEENHGFADVIGNPAAPNLNALAQRFGLATNYFGVTHPSEPNYVALLGGNFFGIQDDNPYFMNTVNKPSLITQLDNAGISWKAYLQSLPYAGYQGYCYPAKCNGSPDIDPLYVSKHDGIQNFAPSRTTPDWQRQVPIEQLSSDLQTSTVPAFNYVIPTECQDMHGDPPYCIDSGNPGDPQDQHLVGMGDQYLGQVISQITSAPFWAKGNNAVNIVFDEGDDNAGCCDANPGGGQVASIVVTSHGPRGIKDATAYNHYSLLQTIQRSFGLGCLEFTCDVANVKPMSPLFAITGSSAIATSPLSVPNLPTPTPTPSEPISFTAKAPSAAGWSVVHSPMLGSNDNSLGAVAASSPNDVWAVGNFVPDTATSNQDATITLANHFDGSSWTPVPTPNAGPNFNTLFGVAAAGGKAWAVGVRLDQQYRDRALIESWDGAQWHIADNPQPGSERDILFGASALSPSDVWAVGEQQGSNGKFETLVEHWNGSAWSVVPSANPGGIGNHLYGVKAIRPDDVWAVGGRVDGSGPDQTLIEHWNGEAWSVLTTPDLGGASARLYSVASGEGSLWAVGESDSIVQGARPLVERFSEGNWITVALPSSAASTFSALWGVTVADDAVWAVGAFQNLSTGNFQTLFLRGGQDGFRVIDAPSPGSGDNVLGGVVAAGGTVWTVGHYKDGGSRQTLIERHSSDA